MSLDVYLVVKNKRVYHDNITHNLNDMAAKAGIYYALWRPEELGKTYAKEIIFYLQKGLKYLKSAPDKYEKYNSPNGWGMYDNLVLFVEEYLEACYRYPNAIINVSR